MVGQRYRLGIGSIILLSLYERPPIGSSDEPHLMARLVDVSTPEMGAAAGCHRDNAEPQLPENART